MIKTDELRDRYAEYEMTDLPQDILSFIDWVERVQEEKMDAISSRISLKMREANQKVKEFKADRAEKEKLREAEELDRIQADEAKRQAEEKEEFERAERKRLALEEAKKVDEAKKIK